LRGKRGLRLARFYGFVDGKQLFEGGFEMVEVEGVGAVGFGVGGVVVDLEEDAVDACGYGCSGEDGDELGLAAGDSVACGGGLDRVGAIKDDGGEAAHDG